MMLRLTLAAFAICMLFACSGNDGVGNDGAYIGGPCVSSSQCDFQCSTSGEFPQGTCTKPCASDGDCPGGTFCIDREGGICLLGCDLPSDCRGGYNCKGEKNRGHGGDSLVCINK
jgi:hypothetical protein